MAEDNDAVVGKGPELKLHLDAIDGVVGREDGHKRVCAAGETGHANAAVRRGDVVLTKGAGEAPRAVAGEDSVVGIARAAVLARVRVTEAAAAHHRAHDRTVGRGNDWK